MQCRSPAFADLRHSVTKARAPNMERCGKLKLARGVQLRSTAGADSVNA